MRSHLKLRYVIACALLGCAAAAQTTVSIKLTTNALGLGNSAINDGSIVDADVAGKTWTSAVTGQGSILKIQRSGVAGSGNAYDKLLATVTSRSHLDTLSGLPANNDYLAGIIYLSAENNNLPDGKDEGLGVRCYQVNGPSALRLIDGATGRAKIEGSKEVSGGTGPSAYIPGDPNGPPHVDEDAIFDFEPDANAYATQTYFTLSKFETGDKVDVTVTTTNNITYQILFQGTTNTSLFTAIDVGAKVWKLNLAGVPGLVANDLLKRVAIKAIDDDPANPATTAEHFLITGFVTKCSFPCAAVGETIPSPTVSLGQSLTFKMGGGPGCAGCFIVSFDPGPTFIGGVSYPIGMPFYEVISGVLPSTGVISLTITIPNDPILVGLTFYGAVGLVNPQTFAISASAQNQLTIVP